MKNNTTPKLNDNNAGVAFDKAKSRRIEREMDYGTKDARVERGLKRSDRNYVWGDEPTVSVRRMR